MTKKIKVVWLCHFSNAFVREYLDLHINCLVGFVKRLAHRQISTDVPEFANWISNGIHEFEKIDEVELHIVSPYPHLKTSVQEFKKNGVFYHFFQNEDDAFNSFVYKQLFHPSNYPYRRNCKKIVGIIDRIQPDIIHLFGAENPYYALGLLRCCDRYITIAQLQTLMNDPGFRKNYPISDHEYEYRSSVERVIVQKADYLGSTSPKYRAIVKNTITPNALFLSIGLLLKEPIVKEECEKKFDFVYFAANIEKAADLAIEAFAVAYHKKPDITLDIIGGCSTTFKQTLDRIIEKNGITGAVTFEGKLPTHEGVLQQVRKSRFALLPLKIDLISGTIREAMANGLPVITTDTGEWGTQKLNIIRKNVLITQIGDHQAMADNMLRLIEDNDLGETLRQNAFQSRLEVKSNEVVARKYVQAYKACLDNRWNNKPLPKEVTEIQ